MRSRRGSLAGTFFEILWSRILVRRSFTKCLAGLSCWLVQPKLPTGRVEDENTFSLVGRQRAVESPGRQFPRQAGGLAAAIQ